jgi:hypothetical protein
MRTTTLLAIVVSSTVLGLTACGDASGTSASNYHKAAYDDTTSTDPTAGAADQTPPAVDPGAPPPAPTTGSTPAADGSFKATVDVTTPTADMGATSQAITVTITPAMAFKGDVVLSVTGLTPGVTAKFDKSTVSVTDTAAVTTKLTLVTDFATQADTLPLMVTATSGKLSSTAPVNFKVNPQITFNIPVNIAKMEAAGTTLIDAYGTTFGKAPVAIPSPKDGSAIVMKVVNLDGTAHEIHGNGAAQTISGITSTASLPHGTGTIATGATDTVARNLKAGQTYNGYLHGEAGGTGASFAVVVK